MNFRREYTQMSEQERERKKRELKKKEREPVRYHTRQVERYLKQQRKHSHVSSTSSFLWLLMLLSLLLLLLPISVFFSVYPTPLFLLSLCGPRFLQRVSNLLQNNDELYSVSILTSPSNHCLASMIPSSLFVVMEMTNYYRLT